MKILMTKSKWEMWGASLPEFLKRAKADGFDAVEVFLPAQKESARDIATMVSDHGLALVGQIVTTGPDPQAHIEALEHHFSFAAATGPLLVNSHTGRDIFPFEDNLRIFRRAIELSRDSGVLLAHETHRSRPTSSGPETRRYLEALEELRLTADFSHWVCVHETDLSDQPGNVALAMERTVHVHARVGFDEGPQVPDPLAPEWETWTATHIAFWKRIIEIRKASGAPHLTITPEFGPPPYMPIEPHTRRPLADTWETNVRFKNHLRKVFAVDPAG